MVNKIKTLRKDSGFTIVELLIVIVVIGILAAITIVSYTGITQKANNTKAQTNAVAVQKVAETYFAENSAYPTTLAHFTSGSAKLPSGVTVNVSAPSLATQSTQVRYQILTAGGGARVSYWDTTTPGATHIYLGSATAATPTGDYSSTAL